MNEHLEIWREPSGVWRWRYLRSTEDGATALVLEASTPFVSSEEARQAAEEAYPGVAIHGPLSQLGRARSAAISWAHRPALRALTLATVLAAVFAVGTVLTRRTRRGNHHGGQHE